MSSRIWAANTAKQNNILDESSSESRDFATAATSSTTTAAITTTTATTATTEFDDDLDDFEIETFDVAPPDSVLLNTTAISARPQQPTVASQPRKPTVAKLPKAPKVPKQPKTPKTPRTTKKSTLPLPQVKAEPQRLSQFSIVPKVEPINAPSALPVDPTSLPASVAPKRRGRPPGVKNSRRRGAALQAVPTPDHAIPPMFLAPYSNDVASFVAPLVAPPVVPKPEPKYVPPLLEPAADTADARHMPVAKQKRKFRSEDDWISDHHMLSSDDEFDLPSKRKRSNRRRRRPYVKVGYRSAFADLTIQERRELATESKVAIAECFPPPPLEPGNAEKLVAVDEFYNALLAPPTVPLAVPAGLPANIMLSRVHTSLVGEPFGRSQMHAAAAYYAYRGKRTRMIERIGRVRSDITFEGDGARTRADSLLPAPQPADTPNGIGGGMERVAHAVNLLTCLSSDPTQLARVTREMRHAALLKFRCAEERAATLAAMSTAHWTPSAVPTVTLTRPVTLLDSETVLPILHPVDRYRYAAAQQAALVAAFGSVNHKAEMTAELQMIAIGDIAQQVASEVPKVEDVTLEEPLMDLPEPEMPEPEF